MERRTRLGDFNLAIDSKLRGCDLVVDDVAPNGYAVNRATMRQGRTDRPVRFELTEVTRQALHEYLRMTGRKQASTCSRVGAESTFDDAPVLAPRLRMGTRRRPRPLKFAMHSMKHTKVTLIYRRTGNPRAAQLLLGDRSTVHYLGVEVDDALEIAEKIEV